MLFLLLRLLTLPIPATPIATAAPEAVVREMRARESSLHGARTQMAQIDAGPPKIRAYLRVAHDPYRSSCVAQRLAEAHVHVSLARDEMQRLDGGPPVYATTAELDRARDDRVYAAKRMDLLAKRTDEVVQAAHACVDDETSSVSAVKVEVTKPGVVNIMDDPTGPPPLLRPDLRPPEH
jgi:hypothetical protein